MPTVSGISIVATVSGISAFKREGFIEEKHDSNYRILIPESVRSNFTGKTKKKRFFFNKTNQNNATHGHH